MIDGAGPNQLAKMSSGDTPECKEKVVQVLASAIRGVYKDVVVDKARRVLTSSVGGTAIAAQPPLASFSLLRFDLSFPLQFPDLHSPYTRNSQASIFRFENPSIWSLTTHCSTGLQLLILFPSRKRAPESLQSLGFVRSSPLFTARGRNVHAKRSPGSPGQHSAASLATECSWPGPLPAAAPSAAVLPAGYVPASSCAAAALRRT